jgi:predicted dehydrogenase
VGLRVGIVGTDSSHVGLIVRYLNDEQRQGPARVVVRSEDPADLLGRVDAVFVCDRDGGRHRDHAMPFLRQGLPVYVDKPLATSVADAEAMVAAARHHGARLTSYSAVRFFPDTVALAAPGGPYRTVLASGPADPDGPYGGVWYYGVHPVDTALSLVTGPIGAVRARRVPDGVRATVEVGDTLVVIDLVHPGPAPFCATVVTPAGTRSRELAMSDHYLDPALDAFFNMVHSGRPVLPLDDLLRPITVLSAIATSI